MLEALMIAPPYIPTLPFLSISELLVSRSTYAFFSSVTTLCGTVIVTSVSLSTSFSHRPSSASSMQSKIVVCVIREEDLSMIFTCGSVTSPAMNLSCAFATLSFAFAVYFPISPSPPSACLLSRSSTKKLKSLYSMIGIVMDVPWISCGASSL